MARVRQSGKAPAQGALRLLTGVSCAALMLGVASTPASAQLARLRANAGTVNPASAAAATTSVPIRPTNMSEALARQQAMQTQARQLATYVQSARVAALASVPGADKVTDGISTNGLNPIASVRALTIYAAAGAAANSVTANAAPAAALAANDPTGLNTWQGATAPVQTTGSTGAVNVTITQTQANALLSWQNFDVGSNTSLVFVQKQGGVANPGWTVVNRVVNAVNPSKILGSITADGTVLILNNSGVIFGPKAQVNLNALIVSSLELGNFAAGVTSVGQTQYFVAASVANRNTGFLQNGLLVNGVGGYQGQILSALLPAGIYNVNSPLPATNSGAVMVDTGATITSGAGGYVILAAPTVMNAGSLYATDGQVSLQAGQDIGAVASAGSSSSVDPNVRGLVLSSQVPALPAVPQAPTPDQGVVVNYGLIESRRGYVSLGTSIFGTVENDGLIQASTSVSRSGKIALTGGQIMLDGRTSGAQASGIVILPDDDGETIPQGTPDSPPSFKTSQVVIGDSATSYLSTDPTQNLALFPSLLTMGENAFIFAPSANVVIGHDAATGNFALQPEVASGVTIASGATIDVAGMMAVEVAAAVNSVKISPAKQNELRDTPNYRSVTTDGSFTLNGATLYVDATVAGVRSDGVAYAGSPLLEAASAISQIPVTAAQLMTKGGTISIDVGAQNSASNLDPAQVPAIAIASGAVLDVAGGWVTYDGGTVLSSELLTASGEAVNIANGDANGDYVAVVNGFTASQPHFGISQTYYNAAIQGDKFVSAYDEGRDAGALEVIGSEIAFDATIYGNAFAGSNQLAAAQAATAASTLGGDPRLLQHSKYQLPTGGLFRIGSFSGSSGIGLGQDIVVYDGTRGSDPSSAAEILLDARNLSNAGLSGLMLQTSGAVTFAAAKLALAAGGTLEVDAGRAIRFDGTITVPGGKIVAQTYQLTSILNPGIGDVGNPFRTDDDIALVYAPGTALPAPFDITVNGSLDTSGQWTNDYIAAATPQGAGRISGGTISLTVAPKLFVAVGDSAAAAHVAGDISGSIRIAATSLLNVSAGGYVSAKGVLSLTGSGGNVSLIDQTTYATLAPLLVASADSFGTTVQGQGVAFTPIATGATTLGVDPTLVVAKENSVIQFATRSLKGFGFAGGGTFRLVSPDIAVSGGGDANATRIPLDFLAETGFGTLNLTAYHARIVPNLFDNGSANLSAFFDTTQVVVGDGKTLNLNQVLLPNILDGATTQTLLALPSDSNVAGLLTAAVPVLAWYQKPANLVLNGLMELDVAQGGSIVGAPLAAITTPKLYNAGTITLPSGTIRQVAALPEALNGVGIGLSDSALGGSGFAAVFGGANASGQYQANGLNSAGFTNADGSIQTNNQIFTTPGFEHFFYFLGQVSANDGIVLASGSVTNLAGTTVYNPVAPIGPQGTMFKVGKIIDGGSILAAAAFDPTANPAYALFANPRYGYSAYPDPNSASATPPPALAQIAPRAIVAQPGSTVDISGTAATLDVMDAAGDYLSTPEWSNGGTIALLGGGTLSGATIDAQGGNAMATGGTLEWLDPTIRATDDRSGTGNAAYADQITKAGFSTLIADGGLTLDGQFTLNLAKALLVQSPTSIDETTIGANAGVVISATAGTSATIAAPYINFSSRAGSVNSSIGGFTGDATATFSAGASGMDVIGGILFDPSIKSLNLNSAADIRLIGVDDRADAAQQPVLDGALVAAGNITFDAARVYTTTGTGNLQRILQDDAGATDANRPSPYLLAALGGSSITFKGDHLLAVTPLSAGSYLQIQAGAVDQQGYLAVPLGRLEFGTSANPIATVNFAAGSVTSVSGAGMNVPYGTTTDLSQYFFTSGTSSPLTLLPSGDLRITGTSITTAKAVPAANGNPAVKASIIDGAGGGDVFAYEFVSGTGGSRDLLSRFNTDVFSSNGYNPATGVGYQYADQRQVYAIVPLAQAQQVALYDPVYAADYGAVPAADDNGTHGPTNLYGVNAGAAVTLDGGNGIAAGQYVLMPAHYALLPGAYRIVANSGQAAPAVGSAQALRDGSIVMGGTLSTAGTGFASSQRLSFTIQSQSSFLKYSDIQTTSGTATIVAAAASAGLATPSIPLDAARVVLDPLARLKIDGNFSVAAAKGGNGSEVDILGSDIVINGNGVSADAGALVLTDQTLANLHANSLMIGGERSENADATTTLGVTATKITVAASADIAVPELILAVAGQGSRLVIDDGASLMATGTLDQTRSGDYRIVSSATASPLGFDTSGIGSLLRLSSGPQRLVDRVGSVAAANANRATTLRIGAAAIAGNALLLDTSNRFVVSGLASLTAPTIALSASDLSFGAGGTVSAALAAKLATATNLTLASRFAVDFAASAIDPATGAVTPAAAYAFNNLTLDTPGLGLIAPSGGADALTIDAKAVRLQNSSGASGGCGAQGAPVCTTTGNTLAINATSLTFGSGTFHTFSFDGAVALAATGGSYVEGAGGLAMSGAALHLTTPFLIDRAAVVDPNLASSAPSDSITPSGNYTSPVTPNYLFATTGAFTLTAPALASVAPAGIRAPGAHIDFGTAAAPVGSLTIDGVAVTATAGTIDGEATGAIALAGAASLATPGTSRSYGDSQDVTTITAGGGTVNLVSFTGDITLPVGTAVNVDSGVGAAGTLNLLAAEGAVSLGAALDAGVAGPRTASLTLDSQNAAFDLSGFAGKYGKLFEGALSIRSGVGDLALVAGDTLKGSSVSLTADGGMIDVAGTIDTAGVNVAGLTVSQAANAKVNGGAIALWGMNGVTLASGSLLDTHTSGYADTDLRQASAGNITIGIGQGSDGLEGGAIAINPGATLNLGATRTLAAIAAGATGNRLVPRIVQNPDTLVATTVYDFVAADTGGALLLRAPVVAAPAASTAAYGANITISPHSHIVGAASRQLEGYYTYNLDTIANNSTYDGVFAYGNGVGLDPTPTGNNILSDSFLDPTDGTPSIPYFIQNFSLAATDGTTDLSSFTLRPGINLVSAGDITLLNNWNLAAGTLNTTAAADAGLLRALPELGPDAQGNPYYAVVAGSEGNLLAHFVAFDYRVGGSASGQAGLFTVAAGGNLDLQASISDGFFNFADKSDPTWINYQLGGGQRTYDPALLASCGSGLVCGDVASYSAVVGGVSATSANTLVIDLSKYTTGAQEGSALVDAPYSDAANSAIAAGNNIDPNSGNPSGNALGFAQLFPLLPDGSAIQSSSLRLVAGAGSSANPLHVDRATGANFTLEGEVQYSFASAPPAVSLGSALDLKLAQSGSTTATDPIFTLASLLDNTGASQLTPDSYTSITWGKGTVAADDLRQAAVSYFADKDKQFAATRGTITGVAAPLGEILTFLKLVTPQLVSGIATHSSGYPAGSLKAPNFINFGSQVAYVRSLVRTGDGTIDVASAGNVDLTNANFNLANYGTAVVYRNARGLPGSARNPANVQVGGTSIYTAGVRFANTAVAANIVGSGARVMVTANSPYQAIAPQDPNFIPSPKGLDDQSAVAATGGGNLTIAAGGSVLALRDDWSEAFLGSGGTYGQGNTTTDNPSQIGDASQRWRVGSVGQDTEIGIAPEFFSSGLGALAGGDVAITAGANVTDLTVALDTSVTTTGPVSITYGRGDLTENVGGDMLAGQIDVANGSGSIAVGGSVMGHGLEPGSATADATQYLRVRLADATVALTADGSIALAGVSALAAASGASSTGTYNQAGYYAAAASFSAIATGQLDYVDNRASQTVPFQVGAGNAGIFGGSVLPPSLTLAALTDTLVTSSEPLLLYPSAIGELNLFSAGNISSLVIAMSDSDPSLLPGAFSAANIGLSSITSAGAGNVTPIQGLGFGIPGVTPTTSQSLLRLYHNQAITHAADSNPVHIFAGIDITNSLIDVAKEAEVIAGRDIANLYFTGQNVSASDTTVVQAGRDILGTTTSSAIFNLPYVVSGDYVLGGPGSLVVQAGRNLGPFINSAVVNNVSYAGGIQTVGNLYNPSLTTVGANLTVLFGVAGGIDYTAFRDAYLNPADFAKLDGALFVQATDALGNATGMRSEQIYAPILAKWLRANAPAAFAAIFGAPATYPDTTAGNAALTAAAYGRSQAMYQAFIQLQPLQQDQFLLDDVYFNELQQAAEPSSPSYLQYFRGYRAIDTLFPAAAGYTDNLAVYTVNPATITANHPQGIPTRNLVAGQPEKATQVQTGNADLRLATLETASGGNLTILGPGGNFIAGSVVRTSTQAAGRVTRFGVDPTASLAYGQIANANVQRISAIPIGFEGVLTLNGGAVDSFTDGNFLVNQSRVFSEAGGDITMWSSNGDLNAGEGPRSASNFPPVSVFTNLDGYSTVDSAGSVSGAGIGAFQRSPTDPTSSVILIAPAGLVDAGDAGVRATGDVLVAAARVANADAFSAGGTISGVPTRGATAAAAAPSSANSAAAAQARTSSAQDTTAHQSVITVDVLGPVDAAAAPDCDNASNDNAINDPRCKPQKPAKPKIIGYNAPVAQASDQASFA